MVYAVQKSVLTRKPWLMSIAGIVLGLTLVALYQTGKLELSGWILQVSVMAVCYPIFIGILMMLPIWPVKDFPGVQVEDGRLRFAQSYSYPIEAIDEISLHDRRGESVRIKIRAKDMDTLRLNYVDNGMALIEELRASNPKIVIQDETTDA